MSQGVVCTGRGPVTRPRTERMIDAALMVVEHALESAKSEGLESRVGHQLREAGMYLAAAYATLTPLSEDGQ